MTQLEITSKESAGLADYKQGFLRIISGVIGIALFLVLLNLGNTAFLIATLVIFAACLYELVILTARRLPLIIIGLLYLALIFTLNIALLLPHGTTIVLFTLLGTWGFDTTAYYIGKKWGNHKILPKISPNKSLEGLIAGIAAVIFIGTLIPDYVLPLDHSVSFYRLAWALVIAASAFGGDALESYFKRKIGVKDSSNLIPGHGGFLDRFDSLFLTSLASLLFFLLSPVGRG